MVPFSDDDDRDLGIDFQRRTSHGSGGILFVSVAATAVDGSANSPPLDRG